MMIFFRVGMYWSSFSLLLMNLMDVLIRLYSFRGWNFFLRYLNRFCILGWIYWMMLNLIKFLMRDWRVGVLFSIRRVVSCFFFFMVVLFVFNSWLIVFFDVGMGIVRVVYRICDVILLERLVYYCLLLNCFFKI